jgi:G3E family GTPase
MYAAPIQHLQASIADRIFLHNVIPHSVEQEAVERKISDVYPIPFLRMDSDSEDRNTLLELDFCDLGHLDSELARRRGQNDRKIELSSPSPSPFQRSWSMSFQFAGDLSMHLCSRWLEQRFLEEDVIRYQGVFSIKGKHEKYIFHGIRGGFWSGGFSPLCRWNHQKRVNHFVAVAIPKGGSTTERVKDLEQTLNSCLAPTLRFGVGEVVQVMIGKKWQGGRVVDLWDEGNPYCVQLKLDGRQVLVPHDEACFIRKRPKHLKSKQLKNRPN